MKRLGSTDSVGGLISICPTTEQEQEQESWRKSNVYSGEFESMLEEEEGCMGHMAEKKRRLSVDQVKALEKNFEVENKLEPERKVKLAQELGLQPRQVAVWFQNRRARWKTKQLERDYALLNSNFDSLKQNYDSALRDHQDLFKQIRELKSKFGGEDKTESCDLSAKEEITRVESDHQEMDQQITDEQEQPGTTATFEFKDFNFIDSFNNDATTVLAGISDFKDGSSDSDSSAILNEDYRNSSSPNAAAILMPSPAPFHTHLVKLEEHNFFTGDEACDFFSDEQPPSLQQWYCHDPWPSS